MSASPSLQIIVVDDHPLFRAGLALCASSRFQVVGEAAGAREALGLAATLRIDVAIIDVLMPLTSGISLTTELRQRQPACRILGLSALDEPNLIADMLIAGATGFAHKMQPSHEILDAISLVAEGVRYLPPKVSLEAVERALSSSASRPLAALTHREREVFELVIRGLSNDEIGTRLSIACRTVETHRQRCANKLSAHSMVEMMRVSALHGGLA
ncbi:response regulator transcription factor [soil metagenome]